MFPYVPPPVDHGVAAAKIAQKRKRTTKLKKQKPRLIRLRAVAQSHPAKSGTSVNVKI